MDLEKLWNERRESVSRLPGTIDDFVGFLGAKNKEALEVMTPEQLEHLPGVKDKLVSYGGTKELYQWRTTENNPYRIEGEDFLGQGDTCEEAALKGLIIYWVTVKYQKRRKQDTKVF